MQNTEFAVVDVETTGLFPGRHDRIIEIAVVRVDHSGRTLAEYTTLVNPMRDIGPSYIHGITSRDVTNAPVFSEIAGDALHAIAGAVLVAHNASFDIRFLSSEVRRLGHRLPTFPYICTMQLARAADPQVPSRKLGDLCDYFDIEANAQHSALGDARATAALFAECVKRLGGAATLTLDKLPVRRALNLRARWPRLSRNGRTHPREEAREERDFEPPYVARLVSMLPMSSETTAEGAEYLLLLDGVLEDRRVTADEAEALTSIALDIGLTGAQAMELHESYLSDMIKIALEDDVITSREEADLQKTRTLLAISTERYAELLRAIEAERTARGRRASSEARGSEDLTGCSVCFTGAFNCCLGGMRITRPRAREIAGSKGLDVRDRVTKDLDYLVIADPDSMSIKAKQARNYGTRIVAELVFWKKLGVDAS